MSRQRRRAAGFFSFRDGHDDARGRRLAAEFTSRGVTFFVPLQNNTDNLRGFEVQDADGYVLYFGRPNA